VILIFVYLSSIILGVRYYTITALELDQYEVLWSREQQYWTRRREQRTTILNEALRLVQYCCSLLHKTSYRSSSSVVIVLLHKALFYYNFEIFENFIILKKFENFEILWNEFLNVMNILKVFKFYENFYFFLIFEISIFFIILKFFENFEI
jgi:hypothetical protein